MNALTLAYLEQARSDWSVFERLLEQDRQAMPDCHPLHYLQMATEKLAKAAILAQQVEEFDRFSHVAFSRLPRQLNRRDVASTLGYNYRSYQYTLRKAEPFFRQIDELNPAVGTSQFGGGLKEGPNVEYPWASRDANGHTHWTAPANHMFMLRQQLKSHPDTRWMIRLISNLLDRFEAIFK